MPIEIRSKNFSVSDTKRGNARRRRSFARDHFATYRLRKVKRLVTRLWDLDDTQKVGAESSNQVQSFPNSAHPLGTLVFCKYCFTNIGTESAARPREFLLAKHECLEAQLAKQPAAPPPYN
jgi:hypothetical protein